MGENSLSLNLGKEFLHKLFIFLSLVSYGFLSQGLNAHNLLSGDLIFQWEGNSEFSKAITDATARDDSLKFVHVGIIEVKGDSIFVIEASPQEGVRIIPLTEFLGNSPKIHCQPAIVVKRLNIRFPVDKALNTAKSFLGQPYDWWYLPDNNKMYCSELVYESYIGEAGEKIFKTKPMNFYDPDGNIPEFWVTLFEKINTEIPQGLPGTNPNDMAGDPRLETLHPVF